MKCPFKLLPFQGTNSFIFSWEKRSAKFFIWTFGLSKSQQLYGQHFCDSENSTASFEMIQFDYSLLWISLRCFFYRFYHGIHHHFCTSIWGRNMFGFFPNHQRSKSKVAIGWLKHQLNYMLENWNFEPKVMVVFGSDDFPDFNWVMFTFHSSFSMVVFGSDDFPFQLGVFLRSILHFPGCISHVGFFFLWLLRGKPKTTTPPKNMSASKIGSHFPR